MDTLLALVHPVDIYTHLASDGHPDHVTVSKQVVAAVQRAGLSVTIHSMLQHPEGTGGCMFLSAYQWPNPADAGDPYARFTPLLDVTAPPTPACSSTPTGTSWGTAGPPDELQPVPADMQATTESSNLKWQVISRYASQIDCVLRSDGTYHPSCGYMRAFVKANEFFWTRRIDGGGSVPVSSGLPVISGAAVVGQSLSASTGTWSGSPSSYAYQWQSCDAAGAGCAAVAGATGSSYLVVDGDLGRTLRVAVTATNAVGTSAPAVSAATAPVAAPSSTGVLGQSAVGTLEDRGAAGYLDVSGPYALGQAATVSTLRAWVVGGTTLSRLRVVIYASSGGQPAGLVAVSPEVTVAAGRAAGWLDVALSAPASLPAGSYWLGYWYGDGNSRHVYTAVAGAERYRVASYSSTGAAPASFGSAATSTSSYALYALTTAG
jgi:LmbE family N-acetylglucosaminyl deacetylase